MYHIIARIGNRVEQKRGHAGARLWTVANFGTNSWIEGSDLSSLVLAHAKQPLALVHDRDLLLG